MTKGCVAIFLHHPHCSAQSVNGIIAALSPNYSFKIFTKHEVEDGFFDDVDVVAFPGGFGHSDSYDYLLTVNKDVIKDFVNRGGKYLGICMGAYWAGGYYFDLLEGVDAVQYRKRPTACTRRPHSKNMPVTWNGQPETMFWNDGCTFTGKGKYKTVASYSNGEPMAIIQGNLGLIGCHPESQPHWYRGYTWMNGLYHNGEHHKLLLNFVDELMKV